MSEQELATPEIFSQFMGTEKYYNYNGQYAFTDGIKYLQDHILNFVSFTYIMNKIIFNMSYKNPFGSFEIEILDSMQGKAIFRVKNENGRTIEKQEFDLKGLKEGTYKIFCYNYVILAASEY